MRQLRHLSDDVLVSYLCGDHGETLRRLAAHELRQRTATEAEPRLPGQAEEFTMEEALVTLESLDSEDWSDWVCRLLEEMEAIHPDEIEPVLEEIKAGIERRLSAGKWLEHCPGRSDKRKQRRG